MWTREAAALSSRQDDAADPMGDAAARPNGGLVQAQDREWYPSALQRRSALVKTADKNGQKQWTKMCYLKGERGSHKKRAVKEVGTRWIFEGDSSLASQAQFSSSSSMPHASLQAPLAERRRVPQQAGRGQSAAH